VLKQDVRAERSRRSGHPDCQPPVGVSRATRATRSPLTGSSASCSCAAVQLHPAESQAPFRRWRCTRVRLAQTRRRRRLPAGVHRLARRPVVSRAISSPRRGFYLLLWPSATCIVRSRRSSGRSCSQRRLTHTSASRFRLSGPVTCLNSCNSRRRSACPHVWVQTSGFNLLPPVRLGR